MRIPRVLLALAVLIAACSSTTSAPSPPIVSTQVSHPPAKWDTRELIPSSGPDRGRIVDALQPEYDLPYSEESLAFHRDVFSDGEVTFEEYQEALKQAADCMTDAGFVVEGPLQATPRQIGTDPRTIITYVYHDRGPKHEPLALECQYIWSIRIQAVWMNKIAPSSEEIVIWLEAAWECAEAMGAELNDPPTLGDAENALAAGCEPWAALPEHP